MVDCVEPEGLEYFHLRQKPSSHRRCKRILFNIVTVPRGVRFALWAPTKIGPKRLHNVTTCSLDSRTLRLWLVQISNRNRLQTNKKEEKSSMKKVFLTLSLALAAGSAFGQGNTLVRWQKIVGVITAPGIDNPVAVTTDANGNTTNLIHSGGLPWATRGGSARVNL